MVAYITLVLQVHTHFWRDFSFGWRLASDKRLFFASILCRCRLRESARIWRARVNAGCSRHRVAFGRHRHSYQTLWTGEEHHRLAAELTRNFLLDVSNGARTNLKVVGAHVQHKEPENLLSCPSTFLALQVQLVGFGERLCDGYR